MFQSVAFVPLPDVLRNPGKIEPGATLGSYEILCSVASGGMACVWVARQRGPRGFTKIVALKTILPDLAIDHEFEEMFLEEALLAARIRHPNVCEIFELVDHEGTLALSMEWVDGDTLSSLLTVRDGPLEPRVAARIVAQAAAGLHGAHELRDENGALINLVHRDVSPMNILLSRDGHVKLSDFGIAKALTTQLEATTIGHVKGKLSYMSPEQARGDPVDRRSDVFALGVVLYVSSVGKLPFQRDGESIERGLARRQACVFDLPARVRPGYPPALERIIVRALQKDPAKRYQTAADMRMDLERWLAASGPLVTEADVAAVLMARRGGHIEERDANIRRCCSTSGVSPRVELVSVSLSSGPARARSLVALELLQDDSDSAPTIVAPMVLTPVEKAARVLSVRPTRRERAWSPLQALSALSRALWAERRRSGLFMLVKRWRLSAIAIAALALLLGFAAFFVVNGPNRDETPPRAIAPAPITPSTATSLPRAAPVDTVAALAPVAPSASSTAAPPARSSKATKRAGAPSRRRPPRRTPSTQSGR
jgi:serine/threonine protein kinase